MKRILFALAFVASTVAQAADKTPPSIAIDNSSDVPHASISTDPTRTYIYVKTPMHWLFDDNQNDEVVKKIDALIRGQIQKLATVNVADPDGDLQTLKDSMTALQAQVDTLVLTAGTLNNQLKKDAIYAVDPTGLLVFAGVELQENFAKVLFAGGSFMLGVSIVPMQVETYRTDTREKVGTSTDYDVAFIAIPTANVGIGSNSGGAVAGQQRGGIGLVFGNLNSASDVMGLAIGPSVTGQVSALGVQAGLNLKFVTLKNFSKSGVFNNEMLLVGVEPPNPSAVKTTSLFGWDVEAHIGVSPIFDPTPLLKKVWNLSRP